MKLTELTEQLKEGKNKPWGLVVYEIIGNSCLNGMWTDNNNSKTYMSEIARRIEKSENIEGEYISTYIESDCKPLTGTLTIENKNNNGIYELSWALTPKAQPKYKGVGFKIGEKQLTAIYWQVAK